MPPRTRKTAPAAEPAPAAGQPRAGPSGLLAYGQAGVYNGVDDRQVITALAGGRTGLMARPQMTAVAGQLTMTLAAGWWAVVDCGDGTSAVIGSRQSTAVPVNAGPASGSTRTDYVWADVDPNGATWTIAIISQAQTAGRAGILLGTLTVPVGAGTASLMTFTPQPARMPLAKGILAAVRQRSPATRNANQFTNAGNACLTPPVRVDTGRWYKLQWNTPDARLTSGTLTSGQYWITTQFAQRPLGGVMAPHGPTFIHRLTSGQLNLNQALAMTYAFTGLDAGDTEFAMRSWSPDGSSFVLDAGSLRMQLTCEDLGPGPGYTDAPDD
ncbi:MAG: hypothetical protein LBV78_02200 [Kitasatospora sp.]|jgi:hypothetical protein|nr:hypothetical protein [Kitasatospora sp.]